MGLLALAAGAAGASQSLLAATGTYTQAAAPGTWSDPSAWLDNRLPNGIDEIANFTALDLPLLPIQAVTLDADTTIGGLVFSDVDPSSTGQWKISSINSASLTLASTVPQPAASVSSTTAEIAASIVATSGFQKSGTGTLLLSAPNTIGGNILLSDGTLHLKNSFAAGDAPLVMSGGRLAIGGAVTVANQINIGSGAGTVGVSSNGSSGTLSGSVIVGGEGVMNVVFGGTGQSLNMPSLASPNFTGTLAFHNITSNYGTFRVTTSLTSGSSLDLGAATVNFGNASVNFGFNQGSVTAIMPYITGGTNAVIGVGSNNRTNHYILGTQGGNQTFYGALRDGGSPAEFIKAGSGTFTLTSGAVKTHDFTGDLLIQGGTFVIGDNANISAAPNIRVQNGTLAIAGNGTLSGSSTISVSRNGALNLRHTSGTFATPPDVTIGGTGNVFGGLVHSAGTLAPGGISKVGTLTLDALADHSGLSFGAGVVELDLTAPGAANIGGGTNDLIVVHGDVNFSPDTIFRFNYLGDSLVYSGQDFPFLYYSGARTGWGSGTLSTTSGTVNSPFRAMFELHDLGGGVIAARIGPFSGGAQSMTWTGSNSFVWDLNITPNFKIGSNATTFFQNDSVTFDDAGEQRPTVHLANATFLPAAVIFNNSIAVNYLLTGPGTIAGNTTVLKNGVGTVTLNTANTYTGNTTINSGVLSSGNLSGVKYGQTVVSSPFGLSTVYVGNAAGDATLSFGSASFVNDVVVSAGKTANLNFNNGSASIFGSWRGGGTINLNGGGGNLNLYADNSATAGTVNVNSPTVALRLANPNAMAGHYWNFTEPRSITNTVADTVTVEIPIGGLAGSGTLTGAATPGYATRDRAYAIGGLNLDSTWNGTISDGNTSGSGTPPFPAFTSVIKQGTASLILTGVNISYSGETLVRGGVLQISNTSGPGGTPIVDGGKLTGTRSVRVGTGGTLRLGTPGGTLSTAGTITTASTGLLLTTDTGGFIDVSSAYDSDPIYNPNPPHEIMGYQSFVSAPGVTWAGSGTISGSIRHQAGTISPGIGSGFGSIGTLHFNDALRLYGGTLSLDVGSISASHDTVIADTLDIASGTVVVNVIGNSIPSNTTYNLMSAANVLGNVTSFQGLVINGRGATGVLQQSGNQINLKILTPAVGARSTWAGGPGATWDVKGGQNWQITGGVADYFYQGDTVTFTDEGAGTVQLATPLLPAGQVTVNNSTTTYWFNGPGRISGNASLMKLGAGTLVITTDNDFTGGVTINDGTLAVGRDNRFDPNGSYSTSSIQNVSLALANKTGMLGTGSIVNNANLVFRKNSPTFVNQNISGTGALYQADFGALVLNGTNTYTGGTTVSLGTLRLGHDNALPIGGNLTLLGTTNFTGGGGAGRGGRLDLAGFSQTLDELTSIGDGGTPGQPMDAFIFNSATLTSAVSTLTINRTGTLGFNSGIRNGTEGASLPAGQIALVKNSTGVATMNYTSSGTIATNYSGRTTINGGTLIVRGTHSPAGGNSYGSYVINSDAALAGDAIINALVSVNPGAILAPGIAGQTGALSVDKLALNSASLEFDLINGAADRINVNISDAFTLSGFSHVKIANPSGTFSAGTFTLIDYSGEGISDLVGRVSLGSTPGGEFNYFLSNNLSNTSLDLVITAPIVSATWQVDDAGTWGTASNWTSNPSIPAVYGSAATFGGISAPRVVTLDTSYGIGTMNFTSAAEFTITGNGSTSLSLGNLATGGGVGINVTAGSHTIDARVRLLNDATINIAAGSTLKIVPAFGFRTAANATTTTVTKTGAGTLEIPGIRRESTASGTVSLNVLGGTLRIAHRSQANLPDYSSEIHSLSIAGGAGLDLTNNSVVIDYNQYNGAGAMLSQLRGWLADGRLYSSDADANHALGYRDNLDISGSGNDSVPDFAGVSTDSTSVLIRYTYAGDSNLDGAVDIQDLYNLAVHYGDTNQVWQDGDFNYDGKVNVADLTSLAANWQAGASAPLSQDLGAMLSSLGLPNVPVPEPSTTLLLGAGLTGLLSFRRRRGC